MVLYGASGHAKVIIDILKKIGTEVSAILDDDINVSSLNGYTVTVINSRNGTRGKQFVFDKAKKMRDWIKENLAATGEVERFSEALDNDENDDTIGLGYNNLNSKFISSINCLGTLTTNLTANV